MKTVLRWAFGRGDGCLYGVYRPHRQARINKIRRQLLVAAVLATAWLAAGSVAIALAFR